MILAWVVAVVGGYFLGTLPWGLIAGKVFKGVDVRQFGSGRLGATNVLRTVGVKVGIGVFLADVGKGAAAAALGRLLIGTDLAAAAAALSAIVGHNWPLYLKLRGGRGMAPFLGGLVLLSPAIALSAAALAAALIALSRYVSLGSMAGAVAAAAFTGMLWAVGRGAGWQAFSYALLGAGVILLQHRDNLARLRQGTERKLGQRTEPLEKG